MDFIRSVSTPLLSSSNHPDSDSQSSDSPYNVIEIQVDQSNASVQLAITPEGVQVQQPNQPQTALSGCLVACCPTTNNDTSQTFFSFQLILACSILSSASEPARHAFELCALTSTIPNEGHVFKLSGTLGNSANLSQAQIWRKKVLSKAYAGTTPPRRMLVVVNPFGGSGRAKQIWSDTVLPIFEAANASFQVLYTTHSEHAVEIGENVDLQKFNVIVCVSGDGIVHEVLNGIGKRPDARSALSSLNIAPIPAGSGNALAVNSMGPENCRNTILAALVALKGKPVPLDLCLVTQAAPSTTSPSAEPVRTLSFLSTAFGLMADLDVGTEHWRWMGDTRFILGYLRGALMNPKQFCRLDILLMEGDKVAMEKSWQQMKSEFDELDPLGPTSPQPNPGLLPLVHGDVGVCLPKTPLLPRLSSGKFASVPQQEETWYTLEEPITSIYAGTLPFMAADLLEFPMKLVGDGSIDIVVHQSPSVLRTLSCINGADQGSMFKNEDCRYFKAKAFRLTPLPRPTNKNSYIVVDGENMPYKAIQAEIHSGLGRVLSLQNRLGEAGVPERFLV